MSPLTALHADALDRRAGSLGRYLERIHSQFRTRIQNRTHPGLNRRGLSTNPANALGWLTEGYWRCTRRSVYPERVEILAHIIRFGLDPAALMCTLAADNR